MNERKDERFQGEDLMRLATCDESCTIIKYTNEYCHILGLSEDVRKLCVTLTNRAVEQGIPSGRKFTVTAAAIVYIATLMSGERRTQREISDATGRKNAQAGLRNRYKEIVNKLGIELII